MTAVDEAEYLGAKTFVFLACKWEEVPKHQAYEVLKTTKMVCSFAETKGLSVNWMSLIMKQKNLFLLARLH